MKKIVMITNPLRDPDSTYTIKTEKALRNKGFEVTHFSLDASPEERTAILDNAFALLVLGGDGTILNAARIASSNDLPILAVNLGRLGYIAQLEKNGIDEIPEILNGDFSTEERAMLSIKLFRNETLLFADDCILNDAVIGKMDGRGIIEEELFAGNTPIQHYRGDGVIIATATGSTAYSMSAGGPIIDPSLKIIEVTPLASHSLKARPIIFSEKSKLRFEIQPANAASLLTLDGENSIPLENYDRIEIGISSKTTKLIKRHNNFSKILYQKLSEL